MIDGRATQTGESSLLRREKWSLLARRWDHRRRGGTSGKESPFRAIGRHARQVERVNADVQPSLWRAASHWLPPPIPRLSLFTPTRYTPPPTYPSLPLEPAPFPQRTLSSTTAGANATTLLIPLCEEDSRPLFRSFSRLVRDAVSLLHSPRAEPTGFFSHFWWLYQDFSSRSSVVI